ncbi:MAG: hypothetical protein IKG47_02730 [Oscillospiraceae bacterium]|nr:hypothetical protein [Oscillospiraceae bacterium]
MMFTGVGRKRVWFRKCLRMAFCILILAAVIVLSFWIFLMLTLQGSFQAEPATLEEILQMNLVERWFFLR